MTTHVTSADGSRIAYDQWGEGPPLIVVGGLLCDRRRTHELADALSRRFRVINYDRRGRGESTEAGPYAVDREVDDLAALIDMAGGTACVYGHSSGAALALRAAASGLPVERLVLHEPPYGADDEESRRAALALASAVRTAIEEERPSDALGAFFGAMGMPPELVDAARSDPDLLAMAPTMPYDHDVVGDYDRGGVVPEDLVRAIAVPTLVLAGTESPGEFGRAAERIAALLPRGSLVWLTGQDHGASAETVARALQEHLLPALGLDGGPEPPAEEVDRQGEERQARDGQEVDGQAEDATTDVALTEAIHGWDQAMVANDAEAIGAYMADEWVIVGPDGSVTSKADFLAVVASGDLRHDVMTSEDLDVRRYGEAAVVIARGVSGGAFRGQPFCELERGSNVFVRRDGRWVCVLTHLSTLAEPTTD